MILNALYQLAEREGLMSDPDYEPKPVAFLVQVDDGGKLLGIRPTHIEPEVDEKTKKKPKPVAKTFQVAREPGRTSGDRANFLVDKAEYAFGLDPEPDEAKRRPPEKLAKRFGLFRERIEECLDQTSDPGVAAVHAFLEKLAAGEARVELPEGCAGNDLFGFVYGLESRLVVGRDLVRQYWKAQRERPAKGKPPLCLVTGERGAAADKHTILKYVPGAVSSGVPLVSFNNRAFESYGWSGNENAVISAKAAETYATALQRLLHPAPQKPDGTDLRRQHLRLAADTVVCYWTAGGSELGSIFGEILDLGEVPELYRSFWHGQVPSLVEDGDAALDRFYALTLSGAQGRVVVRGWFESTVREVAEHLARYFNDIDVVFNTPKPKARELKPRIPMRLLLESLAVQGRSDNVPAPLAEQIVQATLRGTALPLSALQRAVLRMRAEIGRSDWSDLRRRDARAAIIKAVLNGRYRRNHLKELRPDMDPTNTNPGYVLGRLMAVIERLQQTALGDVNASVVDRYFSAASAAPRSVFIRLLKNARHHARKALDSDRTRGFAISLERQVDELANRFDPKNNGFPAHLTLEEQGLFILGYHQQRHALFVGKKGGEDTATAGE